MRADDWARMTAGLTRWQRLKAFFGLGRWRVVYLEDHVRSRPMSARAAKGYALLFNGCLEATTLPIRDLDLR